VRPSPACASTTVTVAQFDTGANTTEIDTGSSKCVGFDPSSLRPGTRELASTQDLEWWIYAYAYQDRRRTHGRARPRALAGPAAGALAVQPRRDRLALAGGAPVARLSVAATSWRTQAGPTAPVRPFG